MGSNCLVWAIRLYLRRRGKAIESYIAIRQSRWGPFPHFLYIERRASGSWRVVSYIPISPRHKRCPPPLFTGRTHWGDT